MLEADIREAGLCLDRMQGEGMTICKLPDGSRNRPFDDSKNRLRLCADMATIAGSTMGIGLHRRPTTRAAARLSHRLLPICLLSQVGKGTATPRLPLATVPAPTLVHRQEAEDRATRRLSLDTTTRLPVNEEAILLLIRDMAPLKGRTPTGKAAEGMAKVAAEEVGMEEDTGDRDVIITCMNVQHSMMSMEAMEQQSQYPTRVTD